MGSATGLLSVPRASTWQLSVLACATSAQQQGRFRDALAGRARLRFVSSFADVIEAIDSSSETVDVIIVPSHDGGLEDAVRTVRSIAIARPRTAIVGCCRAGSQYSTDIRALAAAGVHQFI